MRSETRYWAVVPAAGIGSRMGESVPKQYLDLNGRPVIEHALQVLVDHSAISRVVVAISETDHWWQTVSLSTHRKIQSVPGGIERSDSVLNGLLSLHEQANETDWVLVHDAARPCLNRDDLDKLIDTVSDHPVGGLLGYPLSDTIKRVDGELSVLETLPREQLWRAFTPQMFRYGVLRTALEQARTNGVAVTDEASAVERQGVQPKIIEGRSDNIKITRPEDLDLARFYLGNMAHKNNN
ncbi:MAG: 2-C-methyl-D-erythritol 4-phosphate cytidylyltransferase [Sedimenticola sp.]|nr:2-C-methyl-D-erythritol 4-phosphate cytidylyltransferase [Sedimenticola sp.]